MINFSVTKNGEPLDLDLYNWDERTRTFSTNENSVVLDFKGINGVTFKTGSHCTFNTWYDCIFNTGSHCIFNTGSRCTFITDYNCEFKTKKDCVIIRRDVFEIIKLEKNFNHIKLNRFHIPGYKEIPEVNKELNDFYLTEEDFKIK